MLTILPLILFALAPAVRAANGDPLLLPQTLLTLSPNGTGDTHAIPVTIGNTRLNLVISTTSSRSWVYGIDLCNSLPDDTPSKTLCEFAAGIAADDASGGMFDPTNGGGNSRFNRLSDDFVYQGPNTNINLQGLYASDTLRIADTVIEGMEFGVVTNAGLNSGSDSDDGAVSTNMFGTLGIPGGVGGVLGLGGNSVLINKLIAAGIISENGIGVQIGAKIFFTDTENVETFPNRQIVPPDSPDTFDYPGSIILGGYDAAKAGADAFSDEGGNSAKSSGLTDDDEIPFSLIRWSQTWFDGLNDVIKNNTDFTASSADDAIPVVVDSTSPLILVPQSFWDSTLNPSWERATIDPATQRAIWTDETGYRDWRNFTFALTDSNGEYKEVTLQHFDWNGWDEEVGFWAPLFGIASGDKMVLGRPALRALYAAVDWKKRRAVAKQIEKRETKEIVIERTSAAGSTWGLGVWWIGMVMGVGVFGLV